MFFIVNKTKQHISLPDIKISLGPRQAIDLDKIMSREESEKSRHLKAAKSNGHIEVRVKDKTKSKDSRTIVQNVQAPDMSKIKDEIIKEMRDEFGALKFPTSKEGVSKEDLMEVMKEVMQSMPKEVIIREGAAVEADDEEVEIDESIVADINARTVDKRVKDVEVKSVNYKEEQTDDLLDNIDELEQMLGD